MPELPEVETVRRTLSRHITEQRVVRTQVRRADVVRRGKTLLKNQGKLTQILRHGKQLALCYENGQCACVHLGMSGSLIRRERGSEKQTHEHLIWKLEDGSELVFRDPRRFGGVWVFANFEALQQQRWSKLGPDALTISASQLHAGLARTTRAIKAALLDQNLVAGLGNIYVDEILFNVGISPARNSQTVTTGEARGLVKDARSVLRRAIRAGGSSLRDYVDGEGKRGGYQNRHRVYGRGGEPCVTCAAPLTQSIVAGRTTVACMACQA